MDKQPVLIIYADGAVEMPGALTYGDALSRLALAARVDAALKRQIAAIPLPQNPTSETGEQT